MLKTVKQVHAWTESYRKDLLLGKYDCDSKHQSLEIKAYDLANEFIFDFLDQLSTETRYGRARRIVESCRIGLGKCLELLRRKRRG